MGIVMFKLMFGQLGDIDWNKADPAANKGMYLEISEDLKHLVQFMVKTDPEKRVKLAHLWKKIKSKRSQNTHLAEAWRLVFKRRLDFDSREVATSSLGAVLHGVDAQIEAVELAKGKEKLQNTHTM